MTGGAPPPPPELWLPAPSLALGSGPGLRCGLCCSPPLLASLSWLFPVGSFSAFPSSGFPGGGRQAAARGKDRLGGLGRESSGALSPASSAGCDPKPASGHAHLCGIPPPHLTLGPGPVVQFGPSLFPGALAPAEEWPALLDRGPPDTAGLSGEKVPQCGRARQKPRKGGARSSTALSLSEPPAPLPHARALHRLGVPDPSTLWAHGQPMGLWPQTPGTEAGVCGAAQLSASRRLPGRSLSSWLSLWVLAPSAHLPLAWSQTQREAHGVLCEDPGGDIGKGFDFLGLWGPGQEPDRLVPLQPRRPTGEGPGFAGSEGPWRAGALSHRLLTSI